LGRTLPYVGVTEVVVTGPTSLVSSSSLNRHQRLSADNSTTGRLHSESTFSSSRLSSANNSDLRLSDSECSEGRRRHHDDQQVPVTSRPGAEPGSLSDGETNHRIGRTKFATVPNQVRLSPRFGGVKKSSQR